TLASGLMQQGMTWWQAMVTILLGNVIVLIPMILNAHAGTKYGISFPVLCRASFGVRGANIAAILRAIVACGWFGIQTWIGALALHALFKAAWPRWANLPGSVAIAFAIFWGIQVLIILKGTEGIKILESWSAPLLLGGGALLLLWAIRNGGGLGHILSESQRLQGRGVFWSIFPAALTANVGYWATLSLNIPDFTRYAKSQRCHRRIDHRRARHPDDALEALLRCGGVHLHLAARIFEPDGSFGRDSDRRLLDHPQAAAGRGRPLPATRALHLREGDQPAS